MSWCRVLVWCWLINEPGITKVNKKDEGYCCPHCGWECNDATFDTQHKIFGQVRKRSVLQEPEDEPTSDNPNWPVP